MVAIRIGSSPINVSTGNAAEAQRQANIATAAAQEATAATASVAGIADSVTTFSPADSVTAETGQFYRYDTGAKTASTNGRYVKRDITPGTRVRYATWLSGVQSAAVVFLKADATVAGYLHQGASGNDVFYSGAVVSPAGAASVVINGRLNKACILEIGDDAQIPDALGGTDASVAKVRAWHTPAVSPVSGGYYNNSAGTSGGSFVSNSSYGGIRFPVTPGQRLKISGVTRAAATSLITRFDRNGVYLASALPGIGSNTTYTDYEYTVPDLTYEIAIVSYTPGGAASAQVFDVPPTLVGDVATAKGALVGYDPQSATLEAGKYWSSTGSYKTSGTLGNKLYPIPAGATKLRCVTTTKGAIAPMAVFFSADPTGTAVDAVAASFISPAINVNGTSSEVQWTRDNSETDIPATAQGGTGYVAIVGLSANAIELDFLVPLTDLGKRVSRAQDDITAIQTLSQRWAGNELLAGGTSITAGNGANAWPPKAAKLLGCTMYNQALASAPLRGGVLSNVNGAIIIGSISGTTLTVTERQTGSISIGMAVVGPNVSIPTTITAGSGTSWTVADSQTAASGEIFIGPDPWGMTGLEWEKTTRAVTHSSWFKANELVAKWTTKYRDMLTGGDKPTTLTSDQISIIQGAAFEARIKPYIDGTTASAKLFLAEYGVNDAKQGGDNNPELIQVPTTSAYDRTTAIGAYNWLLREIWRINPKQKIALVGHYENDRWPYIAQMQQYIASRYLLPIIKMWEMSGWSQVAVDGVKRIDEALLDGLHPSSDPTGAATQNYADIVASQVNLMRGG